MEARLVEVEDIFFGSPNISFLVFAFVYLGTIYVLFSVGVYIYNSPAFENFLEFMDSFHSHEQFVVFDRCHCTADNVCEFPELQNTLPGNYRYAVCYFEKTDAQQFESTFRVNISSKESTLKWIQEFKKSSGVSYRKKKIYAENTSSHVFKIALASKPNGRRPEAQSSNKFSKRLMITLERTDLPRHYENRLIHQEGFPLKVLYQCKCKTTARHPASAVVEEGAPSPPVEDSPPEQNVPEAAAAGPRAEGAIARQAEADGTLTPDRLNEMLELITTLELNLRTEAMEKFGRRFEHNEGPRMPEMRFLRHFAAKTQAECLQILEENEHRREILLRNYNTVIGRDLGRRFQESFRETLPPYRLPGFYAPCILEQYAQDREDEDEESEED